LWYSVHIQNVVFYFDLLFFEFRHFVLFEQMFLLLSLLPIHVIGDTIFSPVVMFFEMVTISVNFLLIVHGSQSYSDWA